MATLGLTLVNLAAPKVLSSMTGIVERGVDEAGLRRIYGLTVILITLYLLRVLFRFLSNYLAHKAAWYLVGDLRTRTYDKPGAEDLKDVQGGIDFEEVSFAYNEDEPVLKDVSFHCKPGQMVALVGPTGVGKTTLTQLISRFYEPSS